MQHFEGWKLKTDQEKADKFAQTFAKKTEVVEKSKSRSGKSKMEKEKFFVCMKKTGN